MRISLLLLSLLVAPFAVSSYTVYSGITLSESNEAALSSDLLNHIKSISNEQPIAVNIGVASGLDGLRVPSIFSTATEVDDDDMSLFRSFAVNAASSCAVYKVGGVTNAPPGAKYISTSEYENLLANPKNDCSIFYASKLDVLDALDKETKTQNLYIPLNVAKGPRALAANDDVNYDIKMSSGILEGLLMGGVFLFIVLVGINCIMGIRSPDVLHTFPLPAGKEY